MCETLNLVRLEGYTVGGTLHGCQDTLGNDITQFQFTLDAVNPPPSGGRYTVSPDFILLYGLGSRFYWKISASRPPKNSLTSAGTNSVLNRRKKIRSFRIFRV